MKNCKTKFVMLLAIALMTACTDAKVAKMSALSGNANIKCYSGDTVIYEGTSTGKVANSEQSDGYYFVDSRDNKLKEISGNCVISYINY